MDPIQNQEETQQSPSPLDQESKGIEVQKLEDHHHESNESRVEEQSTCEKSAQQSENGEKDEKLKNTHDEEMGDIEVEEEPMTSSNTNQREERRNTTTTEGENGENVGPRERLKRHRTEVAGQVWIPDMWGQEDFLKDWIDCSAFDSCLVPQGIMSARASLVQEGRRANSGSLRVENSY